jgi:hypothetical protein
VNCKSNTCNHGENQEAERPALESCNCKRLHAADIMEQQLFDRQLPGGVRRAKGIASKGYTITRICRHT